MSNVGNAARTAQALGIATSGIAAGNVFHYSLVLVPTLLLPSTSSPRRTYDSSEQPGTSVSHIATQWRHTAELAKYSRPIVSIFTSSAYLYAAHSFRNFPARNVTTSNLYLLAAALAIAPVPYTWLFVRSTDKKLTSRAVEADAESISTKEKAEIKAMKDDSEVVSWLKTWASLNAVRALFPLASLSVGLYATLGSVE